MLAWVVTLFITFFYLPLLAISVDCNPSTGTITINDEKDASDVAACPTITGDIVIATNAPKSISLDGIESVVGKVVVENVAELESLSADKLESVESFSLQSLHKLSDLSFPSLSKFNSILWDDLPALTETTEFATAPHEGEIKEISISNTSLKSLDWLVWPVGALNISNNAELRSFSLPYNTVNSGSSLTFDSNPTLENISFPSIGSISGAFQISNCGALESLAFDKLQAIGGYMQLTGSFSNITMPILTDIHGGLSIQSTGDIQSFCNELQNKTATGVISGHFNCAANIKGKTETSPNPSSSANPSSQPQPTTTSIQHDTEPEKEGGAPNMLKIGLGAGFGLAAVFAGAFAILYMKYRKQHQKPDEENNFSDDDDEAPLKPPPGLHDANVLSELDSPMTPHEMPSDHWSMAQELPASEGSKELDGSYWLNEIGSSHTPAQSKGCYEMAA